MAFISVANELANAGDTVTLIGSGRVRSGAPYRYLRAASISRQKFESFPSIPPLRNEYAYEELTFIPSLLRRYRPADYDVTLTCSYPLSIGLWRRPAPGGRPRHIFVTQNGHWPAHANNSEYRFFGCDGLVCTNPDAYERNKNRWPCRIIPNGVDCDHFHPGPAQRQEFSLPRERLIVLMVSALIPSKRVEFGIETVSQIPDAHLVVAGDGPLRQKIDSVASRLLPRRFTRLSVSPDRMPSLYRSADVFLHLANEEAFGNVYVKSMACGIPVVAPDSPRVRWIVGDDEFLFKSDNPATIAGNICQAYAISPTQREVKARKAQAFSWTTIGAMYRQFLQEVVTSSHS